MSNNRTPPRSRLEFNIALICALPLEASIVGALFDARYDAEKYGKQQVDTNAYSLGAFGPHDIVLVHMPNMGKVAAATAATNLRASFPAIQLALVVGICGGAPFGPSGELLLGDVVISEGLVQYDLGRRLPNTFVRKDTPGENLPRPRPEVRATLAKLQTSQGRDRLQNEMLEHLQLLRQRSDLTIPYPGPMNDQLFEPKYLHRHRPPSECAICANVDEGGLCSSAIEASCGDLGCTELDPRPRSRLIQTSDESQPAVHFGLVATGDTVMRSGEDRDQLVARDRVIAFEMEGAGVWETFPAALVIKGVCDYADSHKNKTWQSYAAATAAATTKAFLKHWDTALSAPSSFPQNLYNGSAGYQNAAQLDTRQLEIMKRLYTSPYRDRKERNPDRVAGTCEWFTQHQLFLDWKESTFSRLLWVSADPGCGKSVLIKYLVDSILLTTTTRTVCYFFFKDDFEDQKSIVSALCCILYQLFQQNPDLLSEAITNQFEAGGERFLASFSELWHILLTAAQDAHAGEIICILDAIDECEDYGRSQLAKELCKLYGAESRLNLNLKFLVSSRPFGKIRQGFQPLQIPSLPIIHLSGESEEELKKISAEIDTYIKARVKDIGKRLKLDQNERHTLLKELLRVSNRTYLWAYLILDLVESDINIDRTRILQITAHIPKTVDEAYDRILAKSHDPQEATKILHIVVAAERALTLAELGFALAIRDYHRSSHEVHIKSEDRLRENIRDACGLFVTIIHSKVYLLHQTAREFLVRNSEPQSSSYSNMDFQWKHLLLPRESHNILATICIWYLLLSDHDTESLPELSKSYETHSKNSRVFLDYSANYWVMHLWESHMEMNESTTRLILRLCDTNSTRCKLWLRILWERSYTAFPKQFTTLMVASYFGLDAVVKMILSTMTDDFQLNAQDGTYGRSALSWAAGNGSDAVVKLLILGYRGWFRSISLLILGNKAEVNSVDFSNRTPLFYAIWNGNVDVVERLLEAGAQVNVTDNIGGTPLFYAMSSRREAIVNLLLENGAVPNSGDENSTFLFLSAIEKGDMQVIQLFLDSGIDLDVRDSLRMTPLLLAMKTRQRIIVQLLLKYGANVEPEGILTTPLLTAVEYKDPATVQMLLDHGANTETPSKVGNIPLLEAVENQDLDIIKLLLDYGANTEATTEDGNTPLLMALKVRNLDIAQLLLDYGANIEVIAKWRDTPLLTAVKSRDLAVTQFLLDHGANIEAISNRGHTPLFYALQRQDMPTIRALLNKGANIGEKDGPFATELLLVAVGGGYLDLVQTLLNRGASDFVTDTSGSTPLLLAVERGHSDIVQYLLNRDTPIKAVDKNGRTQLSYAAACGFLKATQFLLNHGADIEAADTFGRTSLYHAVGHGELGIMKLLLDKGADIAARDNFGCTPLCHVVSCFVQDSRRFKSPFYSCIQTLLEGGADINTVDSYGRTPLSYATESKNIGVIQTLLRRGSDGQLLDPDERDFLSRNRFTCHLISDNS